MALNEWRGLDDVLFCQCWQVLHLGYPRPLNIQGQLELEQREAAAGDPPSPAQRWADGIGQWRARCTAGPSHLARWVEMGWETLAQLQPFLCLQSVRTAPAETEPLPNDCVAFQDCAVLIVKTETGSLHTEAMAWSRG